MVFQVHLIIAQIRLQWRTFPNVRIGDDVRAQHKFITEKYGIEEIALVVGGSMGAQQTYEWAVRYPDMVKRAAPIAGTAKNTVHDFLFTQNIKWMQLRLIQVGRWKLLFPFRSFRRLKKTCGYLGSDRTEHGVL